MNLIDQPAKALRDTWQARCLAESKGKTAAVVLAVLFHSYGTAMPVMLRVVYPGFRDIAKPFFCSGATIFHTGKIGCDMIDRAGKKQRNVLIFESENELIKEFRDLADRLKLSDAERVELTGAVKRWVVADLRVNHLGEKKIA